MVKRVFYFEKGYIWDGDTDLLEAIEDLIPDWTGRVGKFPIVSHSVKVTLIVERLKEKHVLKKEKSEVLESEKK